MNDEDGRTLAIERLQTLLNRLTAPDLTLAEAKVLRAQVLSMLSDSSASKPRVDPGSSPYHPCGRTAMACEMLCY